VAVAELVVVVVEVEEDVELGSHFPQVPGRRTALIMLPPQLYPGPVAKSIDWYVLHSVYELGSSRFSPQTS
jgi:hypothetical protein